MSSPPPGIVIGPEFSELASSGAEHAWQALPPRKDFTNAFVFAPGKVGTRTHLICHGPTLTVARSCWGTRSVASARDCEQSSHA
jgi:hypothetical protein